MPRNVYMSLIECNDNEARVVMHRAAASAGITAPLLQEEMNFLTGWDTQLRRFHNQEVREGWWLGGRCGEAVA